MNSIKQQTADDSNQLEELTIDLKQSSRKRFGFSIIGGNEYSTSIQVGHIEKGGSADCDGRLKLSDVILQVNDISFVKISHQAALETFKSAGKHIHMRIQRVIPRIDNGCKFTTNTAIYEKPLSRIPVQSALNIHREEKRFTNLKDILKYGNCVKDLRVGIRELLENNGRVEICSWENPDYSGKYVLHRDTHPLTGRPRVIVAYIVLQQTETRTEETDDYIKTIITYFFDISLACE